MKCRNTLTLMLLSIIFTGCGDNPARQVQLQSPAGQTRVSGEYLVTLAPDTDKSVINERFVRQGLKDVHDLGEDIYLIVVSNDPGPKAMRVQIRKDPRITKIQPNLVDWDHCPDSKLTAVRP